MNTWQIVELEYNQNAQHHHETVFTIGNGYLGTRGTFEEGYPGEIASTFVHGVFNDVPIVYTELVNVPNWLDLVPYLNGERFRMDRGKVISYKRELDLKTGVLTRKVRWESSGGGVVDMEIERFANLADQHLLGIRWRVSSVDYSGQLEFRAALPGYVSNAGWTHWEWIDQGRIGQQEAYLLVRTRDSQISLCEAFHLNLAGADGQVYEYWDSQWTPTLLTRVTLEPGITVTADKLVAIYNTRDTADPQVAARQKITVAAEQGYQALRAASEAAWEREWERCNIIIEGDEEADRALRYSLFQLLIAAPRHEEQVSIAAKSLSGYGYRGHVFWDTEIFILPFFIYTQPEIARNLLMYRYHTLQGARRKAKESGYEGAMFAWESAGTGEETTPRWVPGPDGSELVRIWPGDIEHHITADVAYAIIQYWRATGDDAFMRDCGAEIILDTARFWGSRVEWNNAKGCYEITNVIGPDEYHDHVDNNAYTNVLARWNLKKGFEVLNWLREFDPQKATNLETDLDLTQERFGHWEEAIARLYLGYDAETKLFEQFEGFFRLKEVDLRDYEPRDISMQALLGIEGVQEYQIIKQPDVLMMLYLLRDEFDEQTIAANWSYYTPRTDLTHGSSLGPAIQAALAAQLGDKQAAYEHFIHAARTDLEDVRGNTADGIHAATAGGLWQAAIFGFAGIKFSEDQLFTNPNLPAAWQSLQFNLRYRSKTFNLQLQAREIGPGRSAAPMSDDSFPVKGAIFDLDGVLTDTSEYHYLGWQRLADEEGFPFTREDNEALRGISRRESLLLLLKGKTLSEEEMQGLMARKNRYYQESIEALTPQDLLPGARELLEDMRAAGIQIAIGSASKNARTVIAKLGILELDEAISDGHSVARQKPAPDLFLHAASKLGLPAKQCVVVEDAAAGVAAGKAAGMWVVGIGPQERVGAAHVVLPNLEGISWAILRNHLEKSIASRMVDFSKPDVYPED
jgi:beta-phosphoglucomutase